MKIPPQAMAAAPQATATHGMPIGKGDGELASTGFAQALFAAGFTDPASSLPAALPGDAPIGGGFHRGAKNAKQQPAKEPSKTAAKNTTSVPVMASWQRNLVLPLRIQPFSRDTGDSGETLTPTASNATEHQPAAAAQEQPTGGRGAHAEAAEEASNPPAPEKPAAPAGDLAFAAKVQPSAAVEPASAGQAKADPTIAPVQHAAMAAEPAVQKKAIEAEAADQIAVQPVEAGAGASSTPAMLTEVPVPPSAAPSAPAGPTAPAAPAPPVEMKGLEAHAKPAAGPLKDISIQVSQPGDQKVDVRVVQQSGELRVAVRTGDADLAHGLQQGLSDLVGRLQENGFRAEAWRPGGAAVHAGPVFETRTSPGGSQNSNSQPHSGGSQQQPGERRQNQSQRPAWVEELENSIVGGTQLPAQGTNYGIGS